MTGWLGGSPRVRRKLAEPLFFGLPTGYIGTSGLVVQHIGLPPLLVDQSNVFLSIFVRKWVAKCCKNRLGRRAFDFFFEQSFLRVYFDVARLYYRFTRPIDG